MNARQRQLKQQYLETKRPRGVVALRHLPTGKVLWLDASQDVEGTINRVRFALRQRWFDRPAVQAAWSADGEAAFAFEVPVTLTERDEPFDAKAELAGLLALCREEYGC